MEAGANQKYSDMKAKEGYDELKSARKMSSIAPNLPEGASKERAKEKITDHHQNANKAFKQSGESKSKPLTKDEGLDNRDEYRRNKENFREKYGSASSRNTLHPNLDQKKPGAYGSSDKKTISQVAGRF